LRTIADIKLQYSCGWADCCGYGLRLVDLAAAMQHQIVTLAGQIQGDGFADTATGACN
jgi:hypothetical protein